MRFPKMKTLRRFLLAVLTVSIVGSGATSEAYEEIKWTYGFADWVAPILH